MIFQTAYDTTACAGLRLKDTLEQLERARITHSLREVPVAVSQEPAGVRLCLLEGGNTGADTVPYFNHPIDLGEGRDGERVIALDVRNFGKWSAPHTAYLVRNRPEYNWAIKRAILNALWLGGRPQLIRDVSALPVTIYADLLAEVMQRRFALDNGERLQVQVLAAFFYQCQFTANGVDEGDKVKMYGLISRVTRVPANTVENWLDGVDNIADIASFCEQCRQTTGSVALKDLNIRSLLEIVGGTWFGTNSREIMAVAMEHPPTWVMIVAASLSEATFQRSPLSKISKRYDKGSAVADLNKALINLTGPADLTQRLEAGEFAMESHQEPSGPQE